MKQIEKFFAPILAPIEALLNPVKSINEEEPVESIPTSKKGDDKNKKPDPKAKAVPPAKGKQPGKGQQSELAAYESTLPTTTAGIESIVICVDRRLESLPFESLSVF